MLEKDPAGRAAGGRCAMWILQDLANWRHQARHDDGGHVFVAMVPSSTTSMTPSPPTRPVWKTVAQTTTGQKLSGIPWDRPSVNRREWAMGIGFGHVSKSALPFDLLVCLVLFENHAHAHLKSSQWHGQCGSPTHALVTRRYSCS